MKQLGIRNMGQMELFYNILGLIIEMQQDLGCFCKLLKLVQDRRLETFISAMADCGTCWL